MLRFTRWLLGLLLGISSTLVLSRDFYGQGYTIVAEAQGGDDLSVVIHRHLPAGSVHAALIQLLSGTGWRLASRAAADPEIKRLYLQQLPQQKQLLGPMPLDAALVWMGGDAWRLIVDPVDKLISYEVTSQYRNRNPVVTQWHQVPNSNQRRTVAQTRKLPGASNQKTVIDQTKRATRTVTISDKTKEKKNRSGISKTMKEDNAPFSFARFVPSSSSSIRTMEGEK